LGDPGVFGEGTFIQTHQTGNSAAAFAQGTLHFSDTWAATLGGRFTHEEKAAQQREFGTELYTLTPLLVPPPGLPPVNVHDIAQDLSENNFSPAFDLQWRPNEKQMLYASIRRGFKAGGFDNQVDASQADAPALFQFKPETVTAYALGAKLRSCTPDRGDCARTIRR
jgi:iron complex outermembrane receptor protein